MDLLDDFLNNIENKRRESLPEGFESRVLDNWFVEQPKRRKIHTLSLLALAACLVTCSCMNVFSLIKFKRVQDEVVSEVDSNSLETDFVNQYGLTNNVSYVQY
jgi:hypothetical protein